MNRSFHRSGMLRGGDNVMLAVLLLVSVPFLLGAGYTAARSVWYRYFAEVAVGHVVEVKGDTPTLVVEFHTRNGQARRVESLGSDLNENWQAGDTRKVYYDPDLPAHARIDLFSEFWLLPLILGVFGLFFFLPVIFMFGGRILELFRPAANLDRDGTLVQADYDSAQLTFDSVGFGRKGRTGSIRLQQQDNGAYSLMHNGRLRDPMDPAVQRELGLQWIVRAHWTDPATGKTYDFEGDPTDQNPERALKGRKVPVRINPHHPAQYRVEWPVAGSAASSPRTSAIE